ncbi:MAG: hypothetical protein ACRBM6_15985 [Geminicoccales bacterium]
MDSFQHIERRLGMALGHRFDILTLGDKVIDDQRGRKRCECDRNDNKHL